MTGRRRRTARIHELPRAWLRHQAQNAVAALGRLLRAPLPTMMTVTVLGIALALPGGLYVITANLKALTLGWEQDAALSVFLAHPLEEDEARSLAERLQRRPEIAAIQIISRAEALAEFRAYSGFDDVLAGLPDNPLPFVLSIALAAGAEDIGTIERLGTELETLPEVDLVRHDAHWVRRFQAIVGLVERGVTVLAAVLAAALLFIVGNTIRLEIENRREEIHIMELVGATHAFIRRPFLYAGAWYGLLGGLVACLLVITALLLLQAPVSRVAALYQTEFPLLGLSLPVLATLLSGGALLGYLGSWLAVSRHLYAVKPK